MLIQLQIGILYTSRKTHFRICISAVMNRALLELMEVIVSLHVNAKMEERATLFMDNVTVLEVGR